MMMDIKALNRGEPAHNPGSQVGAGDDETDSLVEDSEDKEILPGTSLSRVMRR